MKSNTFCALLVLGALSASPAFAFHVSHEHDNFYKRHSPAPDQGQSGQSTSGSQQQNAPAK
jgi:hypothetical protein